ncbi:phosphonate ABC tranporter, periplasmic phosphonate-binding protein [Synechococcus sp. JA-2-3B'a(2-13)]|uniref:phosphonate ABC transporter substrate-binding protein n=1 Tax=Synechococcus sp. (strain JA-2-3B'a(2-13)) TaxID=321332 RepID=UPI0000694A0A|nr:phosphonate ABC transporter substrate-binding protein [Synechococcus sp. JA-2-3B'a(2-13)]ABD01161.1 phosphonate ABC tranporter, periplasmic phosphonate-binding protein [Synechococcus sp. JA-2-3B'a(2-13)]
MRRRKILFLAAFLMGISSWVPGLAQKQNWPKELVIAEVPVESAADYEARYAPFLDYLKQKLGIPVRLFVAGDYTAVMVSQAQGQTHVAFYGPGSYVDAIEKANAPIEAFVKEDSLRSGTVYHSLILSKKGSGIKTLEDAKGKDFAFVDPESTSGFKVPMAYFCLEAKIKPKEYFKRVAFAGTHESVILGIAQGTIPVGVTWDTGISIATNKGQIKGIEDLEVIWRSDPIPSSPWAYRKDLPEDLKEALRTAYLEYENTPEGQKWLEARGLKGFEPASDADYDPFRKVNDALKKPECQL